ncbi:nucleoside deaminase [Arthrobacter echini]|uniref:Nucleoside deaminase n=1 Tax=Arthrobacter echini TaxID=1529066 RepID=A0A4S5E623_9MICC|nr:nucleoside deaminase [Arthrobacter echini]THJ67036.1 nucleoside deaminase [Arthrobacter echini]
MQIHPPILRRCVELAAEALDAGDEPFGSVIVNSAGEILHESRNRVGGGNSTRHPEFDITQWAVASLSAEERASASVYTSGEHCPMCSAAHALVGLGPIVFASSTDQLFTWLREWKQELPAFTPLPVTAVAPGVRTYGPFPEYEQVMRDLHARARKVA